MKIRDLLRKFFHGEVGVVFRGMATLAMGAGAARAVGVAAIPVLTRLYSPTDYGVLAVFTSLVMMLSPFLTLRYVLAIPLPHRDESAFNILALSAFLMVINTFLMTLGFWLMAPALLGWLSMSLLEPWWWLIIVAAFGSAGYEALTMWATRRRAYGAIARTQLTQSVLGETIKIALGMLALKPLGLLLGQLGTFFGGGGFLLKHFSKDFNELKYHLQWKRMWRVGCYYRGYPTYRLFSQALLILSSQAPLLLTAAYFNAEITGQLGLAFMALALPVSLLGETMSKAFYSEISAIGRKHPVRIRRLTYSIMYRLFILSVLPAGILLLGGEVIFLFAFGEKWVLAGQFASVLAIYLVFQFIQKPVSYLMYVFEGQKELLYLNAQRAGLTILCFASGDYFEMGALEVVLTYSVVLSIHYVFSILLALKKIPDRV